MSTEPMAKWESSNYEPASEKKKNGEKKKTSLGHGLTQPPLTWSPQTSREVGSQLTRISGPLGALWEPYDPKPLISAWQWANESPGHSTDQGTFNQILCIPAEHRAFESFLTWNLHQPYVLEV